MSPVGRVDLCSWRRLIIGLYSSSTHARFLRTSAVTLILRSAIVTSTANSSGDPFPTDAFGNPCVTAGRRTLSAQICRRF